MPLNPTISSNEREESNQNYFFNTSAASNQVRSLPWIDSSLGEAESWPQLLKCTLSQLFRSPQPRMIFWGRSGICFYNDAFSLFLAPALRFKPIGRDSFEGFLDNGKAIKSLLDDIWHQERDSLPTPLSKIIDSATPLYFKLSPLLDDKGRMAAVTLESFPLSPTLMKDQGRAIRALRKPIESSSVDTMFDLTNQDFINFCEQSPAAMAILMGPDFRFVMANPPYESLVNRKVVGSTVLEAFDYDEVETYVPLLNKVYRDGESFTGKEMFFSIRLDDGHQKNMYLNINYTPFRRDDGSIQGILVFIDDITSKVLDRKRLEEAEAKFRAMANSLPLMVWSTLPNGMPNFYNQRWCDYIKIPYETAAQWHWSHFVHPEDVEDMREAWAESVRTGTNYEHRARLLNSASGEYRWIQAQAVPVKDQSGNVVQWYGTTTDIHETILLIEELNAARTSAEIANLAKSSFLANMSHEIRTPLNAILGFTKILNDSDRVEERDKYSKIIARNGLALSKLIDDILDLTKVEAGRLDIENTDFLLDEFLHDIYDEFHGIAAAKGIEFKLETDSNLPAAIKSDPNRLRQILVNLLGNSIKFTSQGLVKISVKSLESEGPEHVLQFAIEDSGVGLTEEQAERLFQPFAQADSSMTRKYGGTGLGLTLSRKVAQALNGDVRIEKSVLGEGSTFIAIVRVNPSDLANKTEAQASPPGLIPAEGGAHILVVDDAPDNRLLVELVLTMAGMKVDVATNGAEAAAKAEKSEYDVILMDMQMPVLDGYAATRLIRSRGYTKPILALSAHVMEDDKKKTLEAGCNSHLSKPLNPDVLLRKIGEYWQPRFH